MKTPKKPRIPLNIGFKSGTVRKVWTGSLDAESTFESVTYVEYKDLLRVMFISWSEVEYIERAPKGPITRLRHAIYNHRTKHKKDTTDD